MEVACCKVGVVGRQDAQGHHPKDVDEDGRRESRQYQHSSQPEVIEPAVRHRHTKSEECHQHPHARACLSNIDWNDLAIFVDVQCVPRASNVVSNDRQANLGTNSCNALQFKCEQLKKSIRDRLAECNQVEDRKPKPLHRSPTADSEHESKDRQADACAHQVVVSKYRRPKRAQTKPRHTEHNE